MIDLFLNRNNFTYKDIRPKNNINLYPRLKQYLSDVVRYFHSSNTIVMNQNIIVQLLSHLEIDYRWSDIDIIQYTREVSNGLLRTLGISNEYMLSTVHPLATMIRGATEMIFSKEYTTITNYRAITKDNWASQAPLTFKNHDFKDLYFNHPSRMIVKDSLVVYDLDIIKLALMFKYYYKHQVENDLNISLQSFVGRFVLTNSIPSMADIVILNKYIGKGHIYFNSLQFIGTTSVMENSKRLDKSIDTYLLNTKGFILPYLQNIELLTNNNAYDLLILEKYYDTSRNKIYLTLVLLDYVSYIINIIGVDDGNKQYATKLKYFVNVLAKINIYTNNKVIDARYKDIINRLRSRL